MEYGSQKAIWGAVVSAAIAFLGAVLTGLQALESGGLGDLGAAVWVSAVLAALVSASGVGGTVYQVANKPKASSPAAADG
jgi:hypothetical protein